MSQVPWSEVWRLYLDHGTVFRRVRDNVRARGMRLSNEEFLDLVHEFLLTRAPFALATYRPDRGSMAPWLFVVFRRFVAGARAQRIRHDAQASALLRDLEPLERDAISQVEAARDVARIRRAIDELPSPFRRALRVWLRESPPSIRAVARNLGVSRWQAGRLVDDAVARVRHRIGANTVANDRTDESLTVQQARSVSMSRYVDVDVPIEQADVSSYVGVEDLRAASAEVELERFLSRPVESEIELSSPAAQRMLEHAATCERCGELLARNIDHAAALMEATQTDGPPDEEAEEIAAAKEADVLLTSKAILATLLPQTVEELSAHVPDDLWNKLPSLRTRSTNAELRAALSVAEASLAIQSVLASNWEGESTARFAELDLVVDEHRIVPGKYFAARIADCIDVALGTAQNVWAGFVSVVAGSRVGLAGLHAEELDGHWKLRLSLDDFGRMRESDERSRAEGSLQQR